MDIEALKKLNELKEKGLITQEEFEEQKKELLKDNILQKSYNENITQNSDILSVVSDFANPNTPKKHITYLWLSLLGILGLHNFYLGQTNKGLIKLLGSIGIGFFLKWTGNFELIALAGLIQIWIATEVYDTFKTSSNKDLERVSDKVKDIFCGISCGIAGCEFGIILGMYILQAAMQHTLGGYFRGF